MNTSSTSTSANQQMIKRIATRVKRSRLPSVASALAFTTVLALVPLLTVFFAILSMFPFFFEWRDEIETFLYSNLVPATGDAVKVYLQEFAGQAGTLTGLGLAALLLPALLPRRRRLTRAGLPSQGNGLRRWPRSQQSRRSRYLQCW